MYIHLSPYAYVFLHIFVCVSEYITVYIFAYGLVRLFGGASGHKQIYVWLRKYLCLLSVYI